MFTYILRRVLYMIPTIILISILSFLVVLAPPGDFLSTRILTLQQQYGKAAEDVIASLRQQYGLGQPAYKQYIKWVKGMVLHGNMGYSFSRMAPVEDIIKERVPPTILITFLTLIFIWIIAIPIGIFSAVKQYSIFDYIFTFFAFIGQSIPNFLLALVGMFFLYAEFGWNVGGLYSPEFVGQSWTIARIYDLIKHLPLPIFVIGTAGTGGMVRVLRGMMLDELGKEYVQTARAKGLTERTVIFKHVFKIAILPIISTIGWLLPQLVGGAMITSIVLNLPTTGTSLFNALRNQDMYVAGSFILLLSTLTVIGTLISDIALAQLDPRIRYE